MYFSLTGSYPGKSSHTSDYFWDKSSANDRQNQSDKPVQPSKEQDLSHHTQSSGYQSELLDNQHVSGLGNQQTYSRTVSGNHSPRYTTRNFQPGRMLTSLGEEDGHLNNSYDKKYSCRSPVEHSQKSYNSSENHKLKNVGSSLDSKYNKTQEEFSTNGKDDKQRQLRFSDNNFDVPMKHLELEKSRSYQDKQSHPRQGMSGTVSRSLQDFSQHLSNSKKFQSLSPSSPKQSANQNRETFRGLGHETENQQSANHNRETFKSLGHEAENQQSANQNRDTFRSLGHEAVNQQSANQNRETFRSLGHETENQQSTNQKRDTFRSLVHEAVNQQSANQNRETFRSLGHETVNHHSANQSRAPFSSLGEETVNQGSGNQNRASFKSLGHETMKSVNVSSPVRKNGYIVEESETTVHTEKTTKTYKVCDPGDNPNPKPNGDSAKHEREASQSVRASFERGVPRAGIEREVPSKSSNRLSNEHVSESLRMSGNYESQNTSAQGSTNKCAQESVNFQNLSSEPSAERPNSNRLSNELVPKCLNSYNNNELNRDNKTDNDNMKKSLVDEFSEEFESKYTFENKLSSFLEDLDDIDDIDWDENPPSTINISTPSLVRKLDI